MRVFLLGSFAEFITVCKIIKQKDPGEPRIYSFGLAVSDGLI